MPSDLALPRDRRRLAPHDRIERRCPTVEGKDERRRGLIARCRRGARAGAEQERRPGEPARKIPPTKRHPHLPRPLPPGTEQDCGGPVNSRRCRCGCRRCQCPGATSRSAGAATAHSASAWRQRVRNAQPEGGSSGLGGSPVRVMRARRAAVRHRQRGGRSSGLPRMARTAAERAALGKLDDAAEIHHRDALRRGARPPRRHGR